MRRGEAIQEDRKALRSRRKTTPRSSTAKKENRDSRTMESEGPRTTEIWQTRSPECVITEIFH